MFHDRVLGRKGREAFAVGQAVQFKQTVLII